MLVVCRLVLRISLLSVAWVLKHCGFLNVMRAPNQDQPSAIVVDPIIVSS
jgi:hypothetical protein